MANFSWAPEQLAPLFGEREGGLDYVELGTRGACPSCSQPQQKAPMEPERLCTNCGVPLVTLLAPWMNGEMTFVSGAKPAFFEQLRLWHTSGGDRKRAALLLKEFETDYVVARSRHPSSTDHPARLLEVTRVEAWRAFDARRDVVEFAAKTRELATLSVRFDRAADGAVHAVVAFHVGDWLMRQRRLKAEDRGEIVGVVNACALVMPEIESVRGRVVDGVERLRATMSAMPAADATWSRVRSGVDDALARMKVSDGASEALLRWRSTVKSGRPVL